MDSNDSLSQVNAAAAQIDALARAMDDSGRNAMQAMDSINASKRKLNKATLDTAEVLRIINAKMDEEKQARIQAELESKHERKIDRIVSITIGLLTLTAAVLFGILGLPHP